MRVGKPESLLRVALNACEALRELRPSVVDEMFDAMEKRVYDPAEHLIRQGDPGDCLLVIVEGSATVAVQGLDGGVDKIGRCSTGEVVGEMALVTREPRTANVVAESSVCALALPAEDFHRIAGRNLELGMVLTRLIGDRLGQAARDGLGDKVVRGHRILRRIGRGGMSIVYEAERPGSAEHVALKMMSHRLVYERGALARFRHEADIVRALDHANIAAVHDRFAAFNTEFLVMELCNGSNLSEVLKRVGPLPEESARCLLGQIAAALEYVHQRGVIHRDVKPSNVMLLPEGLAKLMDFGVAHRHVDEAGETVTDATSGALVGTLTYMPPEQLAGREVDQRVDFYALGCLGFELLAGRSLFKGGNIVELVQEKMGRRLPPAGEIGQGISDELHGFLSGVLQPDPAERPATLGPLLGWAAPVVL